MVGCLRVLAFGAAIGAAHPALGCSIVLAPPAPQEAIDAQLRMDFNAALDLVTIRMLSPARHDRIGRAVVVRSATGRTAIGRIVRIRTFMTSMCGFGDTRRGDRHTLYLRHTPPYHLSPLSEAVTRRLVELQLLPATWH